MYPYLIRITFVVFFMIIISILMGVPTCLCVDHEDYVACGESFQCANIPNIGYPFWGEGRNQSCGYPGFQLYNCQGDVPLINIQSLTYRVLEIDSSGRTLTVAREDLWNNTCPTYLHNTTLDFTRFTYASSAQNVTLHYGCTALPGQLLPLSNQFPCTVNDSTNATSSYFVAGAVSSTVSLTLYMMCSNNVIVPVNQTSGEALTETSASIGDLRQGLAGGFGLQWEANNTNCNRCELLDGRCGYNLTANSFACYCADQPYSVACPQTGNSGSTNRLHLGLRIAIGFSIIVAMIILSTVIICCVRRQCLLHKAVVFWKKEEMNDQNIEAFIRNHGSLAPKRYNYLQIKKMTNSFKEKIGEGGYGGVYKGKLSDGVLVAVKFLRETKGNGEEFINEIASISRTSHVNVVTLLGFCYERNKRALIYEFMPNGSLDKFIYNERSHLDWKTLYQIAVSAARGLEYLHRGCNTSIVHLDIKPQNILLDEDFCPKISDFGLAKLCKRKESVVSMMGARGTVGYIAPEVFSRSFGAVSHKSDVYSYGMLVLDIAGARKKIEEVGVARTTELYFPDWIYERIELHEDLRVLYGVTTEEEEAVARKMILVSLWCIQTNPMDRPSMRKVVEMLEGSLQSLQIPPKPFLFSPPRVAYDSCPSLSLSSENFVELTTSINQ